MTLTAQLIPVGLCLIAVLCWGSADFIGGIASRRWNAFLITAIGHVSASLTIGTVLFSRSIPVPSQHTVMWSVVAGAIGGVALSLFYRALSMGQMGLKTPLAAVIGAAIPTIMEIAREGSPGGLRLAGFLCAGCGVWLISRQEDSSGRTQGLWLAAAAGLGFAGYYLCVHQAGDESAPWIAAISRVTSLAVTAGIVLLARAATRVDGRTLGLAAIAGVLDMTGTVTFIRASQLGRLDVAVVLSSLYPAVTVLLARMILKERFTAWKTAGILAALAAVPLIALQ